MKNDVASVIFLKNNYAAAIDSVCNATINLFRTVEIQYDADTNHGFNKEEQDKWNENIGKLLKMVNYADFKDSPLSGASMQGRQ